MAFKIIVCAKQVPDTNVIKINPATGTLIRDGVPSILNHDDNNALEEVMAPKAMILDENSFKEFGDRNLLFVGNGVSKWKEISPIKNAHYLANSKPEAVNMVALSELAFRRGEFIDVAYSTPLYLKEFQATTPKHKVI